MKKDDLLGYVFDKLTVIAESPRRNNRTYWMCRCECGTELEVLASNLKRGNTKSCGYCGSGGKKLDLTGQRYGRLTVIKPVEKASTHNLTHWLCRCDCGNETVVSTINIRAGHTKSCGCYNKEKTAEMGRNTKKYNTYSVDGKTVTVLLNERGDTMLCDIDDWERLKEYKWNILNNGYVHARNPENGKAIFFHQVIMGERDGLVIDHINRNKRDNRKCNLRFVTFRANTINKDFKPGDSGVVGVGMRRGKWEARVYDHGRKISLGRFDNIEDAVKAREEAVKKYYNPLFEVKP